MSKQLNQNRRVPNNTPFRLPDGSKNPDYAAWYKKWMENPIVKRERNRKQSEKTRKKPEWTAYFNAYFRQYYAKNKPILLIRGITSNIRHTILHGNGKLEALYSSIYDNLQEVGWTPYLNPKDKVLNHIISIKLLYEFCPKLPRECFYDVDNIEVVNRGENNSASKRIITEDTLRISSILEKKYPHWLRGLTNYLMRKRGDLV